MGGYADKLQKRAAEFMRPGEQMIAAIRTQPRGATVGTAVGGLAGAAIAGRQAKKAAEGLAEGSIARNWPQGRFAVGLTNQRVLTFNYTAMGKPKDLTAELGLNQIADVALEKGKITNIVRFHFADGSAAEVECAKLEKVDDFISAYRGIRAAPTGA